MDFLKQCNELMRQNQEMLKDQLMHAEERLKQGDQEREQRVQELQVGLLVCCDGCGVGVGDSQRTKLIPAVKYRTRCET
jgi:hypothetical protein